MNKLKVIGFLAGPGAGKSTTAWGLAHLMKIKGMSVELIHEYAKEVVWEERLPLLDNQLYLFAKQEQLQRRLIGKVEYCVTDSPLLLELAYIDLIFDKLQADGIMHHLDYLTALDHLRTTVKAYNECYDNIYIYINRIKSFDQTGRVQNLEESLELDDTMVGILENENDYYVIDGGRDAPRQALEIIIEEAKEGYS